MLVDSAEMCDEWVSSDNFTSGVDAVVDLELINQLEFFRVVDKNEKVL